MRWNKRDGRDGLGWDGLELDGRDGMGWNKRDEMRWERWAGMITDQYSSQQKQRQYKL